MGDIPRYRGSLRLARLRDLLGRLGLSRRVANEGRTALLKKSRWLLVKREENPKAEQRFRLRDLLGYNLKTVRAYLLKEAFQQLWDYNSPAWAGKFLDEWCRQTLRSRIEPMKKIARSLRLSYLPVLELALYHSLGKLPQPESTHDFF